MKAEIDKDGALTITAETPVEQFALKVYWERWGTPQSGVLRMIWNTEAQTLEAKEAKL